MKSSITTTAAAVAVSLFYTLPSHHYHVLAQTITANETDADLSNNTTTTTSSSSTSPPAAAIDYTQQIELSSNMTINWSIHDDTHTRYCGPRTVGGYEVAKKYCSPQTACGLGEVTQGTYGGSGNDCKGRKYVDLEETIEGFGSGVPYMCFTDIRCVSPSNSPSVSPSLSPSTTMMPSTNPTNVPTTVPSTSVSPTINGQTKSPTVSPTNPLPSASPTTETNTPTGSPVNVATMKIRGYFCGTTYANAIETCNASRQCNTNEDCVGGNEEGGEEKCFPNVSCEFLTSESGELGEYDSSSSTTTTTTGDGVEGVKGENFGVVRGVSSGAMILSSMAMLIMFLTA